MIVVSSEHPENCNCEAIFDDLADLLSRLVGGEYREVQITDWEAP